MWDLEFISQANFEKHVANTIKEYGDKLVSYDLDKFNSNIIDPIKLIFDKMVYQNSWEEIVKNEIFRQRDKSNNNDIGYFHQKIFQYIDGCQVPEQGWDVIVERRNGIIVPECGQVRTIYVEMKNKHNTMNSSAAQKTYINMQSQILQDDDCACFLVETIAKKSQNITWEITVNKKKSKHKNIRKVSMDQFYSIVTGDEKAFYKMCVKLPGIIENVVRNSKALKIPNDTAYEALKSLADDKYGSFAMALYMLGFSTYNGFDGSK